jgi:hypothetical protein
MSRYTLLKRLQEHTQKTVIPEIQSVTFTIHDEALAREAIRHNTAVFIRRAGKSTTVWRLKIRGITVMAIYHRSTKQVTLSQLATNTASG